MKTLSFALLFALSINANAGLTGEYPVCVTEEALTEMQNAATSNNMPQFVKILDSGYCRIPPRGARYKVLDLGRWPGNSKIRAYDGKKSIVVFTPTANLQ